MPKPLWRSTRLIASLFTLAGACAAAISVGVGPALAAPNVVASLPPVHSLAVSVMAGVATPELLIRGTVSEHSYTLRPSDAHLLEQADIVFWVGEDMETFLVKPLAALAGRARIVALGDEDLVPLLSNRPPGIWSAGNAIESREAEHAGHAHGEHDLHVWLDPRNARRMAGAMAETLAAVDPDNAARYETNAAMLGHTLDALDRELDAVLAPVRGVPFLVFHDAYQYFERRYGLRALGAVTLSPERRPGARRIYEMRDALARLGARCVFREPLYDAASVEAIVSGTGAGTGTLDPLGVDLQIGADLYFSLLRGLASSLRQCLAR